MRRRRGRGSMRNTSSPYSPFHNSVNMTQNKKFQKKKMKSGEAKIDNAGDDAENLIAEI